MTGLTAAFRLLELAPETNLALFESSNRLGGVVQTERRDGYTLELGPDSMLRRLPWGVGLCRRLGIENELVGTEAAAKGVYTVHHGRAVKMPEGLAIMAPERIWPMVTTPILSCRGKARMAAERFVPTRNEDSDESLADFARRRLGQEAYERIVQPLAGGIFMGDPERLSLQACFPPFAAMEAEHGSLIKATRQARRDRMAKAGDGPPPSVFTAPRDGLGQMIAALADKLGARAQLGQRVAALRQAENGWLLTVEDVKTGEQRSESFDAVIVAAPAAAAAELLAPINGRVGQILSGLEYSSCAIVQLAYPVERVNHPLDAAGLVVPHIERRTMQACSFSSVKYAGRAPDGMRLFRVFLGGALQPELPGETEERLVEMARQDVGQLLGVTGEPSLVSLTRWKQSMPQYGVGHLERVAEIEELATQHHGLELAGAAFRGVGIPHCIHSAEQAVERLLPK